MAQAMHSVAQNKPGAAPPSDVLGAAVERLNDVVIVAEGHPVDEPGPRILFVHPAFEKMTGYTSGGVGGRPPRFLRGLDPWKPDQQLLDEPFHARKPVRVELLN